MGFFTLPQKRFKNVFALLFAVIEDIIYKVFKASAPNIYLTYQSSDDVTPNFTFRKKCTSNKTPTCPKIYKQASLIHIALLLVL